MKHLRSHTEEATKQDPEALSTWFRALPLPQEIDGPVINPGIPRTAFWANC